jgi:hypothetical protein
MTPDAESVMFEAQTRALAMLAERTVVAEARAKMLEVELAAMKQQFVEKRDELVGREWDCHRWWAAFWRSHGVSKEKLQESALNRFSQSDPDAKQRARDLIENGTGTYTSPDRDVVPDFKWSYYEESPVPLAHKAPDK